MLLTPYSASAARVLEAPPIASDGHRAVTKSFCPGTPLAVSTYSVTSTGGLSKQKTDLSWRLKNQVSSSAIRKSICLMMRCAARTKVYFDIEIGGTKEGRVIFELVSPLFYITW